MSEGIVVEYEDGELRCKAPPHLLPAVFRGVTPFLEEVVGDAEVSSKIDVRLEEPVLAKVNNNKRLLIEMLRQTLRSSLHKIRREGIEGNYIRETVHSNFKEKVRRVAVNKKSSEGGKGSTTIYIVPSSGWSEDDKVRIKRVFSDCEIRIVDELPMEN